jgi:nucleoside phosphorylase
MATFIEAEPFINRMSLNIIEEKPFQIYRNDPYILILSGIGKAYAAMATTYCCYVYKPRLVLNLGAAGAVNPAFSLGDIFHIEKVIELDRPQLGNGAPHVYKPCVLDGFKYASCATQDKPIYSLEERETILKCADMVEMEAASVIMACEIFGVKAMLFKFISDDNVHSSSADILNNIFIYRNSFYDYFLNSILSAIE